MLKVNAVFTKKAQLSDEQRHKKTAVINFIILLMGLLCGVIAFIISDSSDLSSLSKYYLSFAVDFSGRNKLEIICGILLSHLPYLISVIICSTSILGVYIIPALSFCKCMGLSYVVSYIVRTYGIKGIEYCIMIFYPGKFFLLLFIMLSMYIGVSTSKEIKQLTSGESQKTVNLYNLSIKLGFAVMILLIACCIDFLTIIFFSTLFSFT